MQKKSTDSAEPAALELSAVSKRFGGQYALDRVGISVQRGQVHALVGHNGSGKSTLVKLLSGYHTPEAGATARAAGHDFDLGSTIAARNAGLRFIHQDLGLIESMSVLDNLSLGIPSDLGPGFRIRRSLEMRRAYAALSALGYNIDVNQAVATLPAPERTGVAIARALYNWEHDVRLLVLDEPTASMPSHEVRAVLDLVRTVAARGVGVLYISHRLDEVIEAADWMTVLRDGRVVISESVADHTVDSIAELMVGSIADERPSSDRADLSRSSGEVAHAAVLSVEHLAGNGFTDVSFDVRGGEVVGIAGLTGSGREGILGSIFGHEARTGEVIVSGHSVPPERIRAAIEARIAYVPASRVTGFFSTFTALDNVLISHAAKYWKGVFNRRAETAEAQDLFARLDVRPRKPQQLGSSFSGGNQQKIMIAKWLAMSPLVLLLEEPTQGVDIAAKARIHEQIDQLAQQGCAVVVSSSESEELERLCGRVLIMRNGHSRGWVQRSHIDADSITRATLGGADRELI